MPIPEPADLIDMRALLDALIAAGLDATLFDTGGDVMSIGVAPVTRNADDRDRYTLLLGGSSWHLDGGIYAAPGDFHIGPDDEHLIPDLTVNTTTDVHRIAAATAAIHRQRAAGAVTVADIEDL
jgi:hypothetical protein